MFSRSYDVNGVNKIEFRPYMVECAHRYFLIALNERNGVIKKAVSALVIEILLKSFNAIVKENEGEVNESYEFNGSLLKGKSAHNLINLASILPPEVKAYLFSHEDMRVLKRDKNSFTSDRYIYEPCASKKLDFDLFNMARDVLCKVVYLYGQQGCQDKYIAWLNESDLYSKLLDDTTLKIYECAHGKGCLEN